ncbi:aldo/keto reductase family protein [Murimonas intestini]|uniref:Diketogulonate reductase-like aldo/keto reductase n=1 Tax=Murimonas intestini TaxID=1337051 RepID=A0AB73T4V2_9FIRM|nr:aldo/keto reductase [Murimonas intestini]MCR1840684.1 aldo/keto reductase [Murimonas intestini]MCR1865263.1 aldo/keto reductase [Murimonas intestini]MCR1883027.1 aldo/keto reductase [Murimonas intestini]
MFGKQTSQYKKWVSHAENLGMMPMNLDIVNTGSTPSLLAYDYNLWKLRGFNMASQPQPLYYDFETLKKYANHLRKGAIVIISIEEFKLIVDAYENESSDHKYYLWLNSDQIRTYSKSKDFLLKKIPIVLHPQFLLHDVKRFVNGLPADRENYSKLKTADDIEWANRWMNGWKNEFGWNDRYELSAKQIENIRINTDRLKDMVDFCRDNEWTPYLVISPFSPTLESLMPTDILDQCLWNPVNSIAEGKKVSVINLYSCKELLHNELYENALCFNDSGRLKFNKLLQDRIGVTEEINLVDDKKMYMLRNEITIPWISFGTGVIWRYTRNKLLFGKWLIRNCLRSIKHMKISRELYGNLHIKRILHDAYDTGYRMFDSGRIYAHSEESIGATVSNYQDVFLATKCSAMDVTRAASPNDVAGNLDNSLSNLKKDHVDLYMLHWPEGDWLNYYKQIIDCYNKGKCRAFGACNLNLDDLKKIKSEGIDLPMVVQTEIHPLCVRKELRDYCREHGIQLMAHTSTGNGTKKLRDNSLMKHLMEKYHKSCTQIVLRWHYQNNVIPVISTFHKEHMKENLDIFDFELTSAEMKSIDGLDENLIVLNSHGIDDPNYIYNF